MLSCPSFPAAHTDMQGRQFRFLATLLLFWVTARVGIIALDLNPNPSEIRTPITEQKRIRPAEAVILPPSPMARVHYQLLSKPDRMDALVHKIERSARGFEIHEEIKNAPVAEEGEGTLELTKWSGPLRTSEPRPAAVTFYAYSFFRVHSSRGALSTAGQYGGSQSGFVVAVPLVAPNDANSEAKFALQLRGALAHHDPNEREFSAGLRWRSTGKVPLSFTLERRFRNDRVDAFSAYLAGGKTIDLPFQSRLESYAQAGYITGKAGGPFFDFSARAARKLGASPVTAGFGVWGGGQTGIFRIDAGPTIAHTFEIADTRFHVSADWRTRIAGDAAPASGPAVTLSTSF